MRYLKVAVDYLKLAVWDEPAIVKDKYSEPMSLPESLGGPSGQGSKDKNRSIKERKRDKSDSECPRKAFPFKTEEESPKYGKVTENLPMAIETLYVVEEENKKKR